MFGIFFSFFIAVNTLFVIVKVPKMLSSSGDVFSYYIYDEDETQKDNAVFFTSRQCVTLFLHLVTKNQKQPLHNLKLLQREKQHEVHAMKSLHVYLCNETESTRWSKYWQKSLPPVASQRLSAGLVNTCRSLHARRQLEPSATSHVISSLAVNTKLMLFFDLVVSPISGTKTNLQTCSQSL